MLLDTFSDTIINAVESVQDAVVKREMAKGSNTKTSQEGSGTDFALPQCGKQKRPIRGSD